MRGGEVMMLDARMGGEVRRGDDEPREIDAAAAATATSCFDGDGFDAGAGAGAGAGRVGEGGAEPDEVHVMISQTAPHKSPPPPPPPTPPTPPAPSSLATAAL